MLPSASVPGRMLGSILPREAIAAERARRGNCELVAGCIALLHAQPVDDALVLALAGAHAASVLESGPEARYWLRVWAAHGFAQAAHRAIRVQVGSGE